MSWPQHFLADGQRAKTKGRTIMLACRLLAAKPGFPNCNIP